MLTVPGPADELDGNAGAPGLPLADAPAQGVTCPYQSMPGGMPEVTSNGSNSSTGRTSRCMGHKGHSTVCLSFHAKGLQLNRACRLEASEMEAIGRVLKSYLIRLFDLPTDLEASATVQG